MCQPGRCVVLALSDKEASLDTIPSAFFRRSEGEQVIVGIEKLACQSWLTTPDQMVKR
jgi:hypothetical protein